MACTTNTTSLQDVMGHQKRAGGMSMVDSVCLGAVGEQCGTVLKGKDYAQFPVRS